MKLLLILLNIIEIHTFWESIFTEEFNGTTLDQNKWLAENDLGNCDDNPNKPLNCNTDRKRNVRLINGTLAITAFREHHINKEYTSALINSKANYTFGKFIIRAALPSGRMLRPIVSLKPTTHSGKWSDDGEIVILTKGENNWLKFGIYFTFKGHPEFAREKVPITKGINLNEFHTYALEWNENGLSLKFDGDRLAVIDLSKELKDSPNPFIKSFTLSVGLEVGGEIYNQQILTPKDVNGWKCSALIVDYIRIYRWNENKRSAKKNEPNLNLDDKSSVDICNTIMDDIRSRSINDSIEQSLSGKDSKSSSLASSFQSYLITFTLIVFLLNK